jgi:hypothetical protein
MVLRNLPVKSGSWNKKLRRLYRLSKRKLSYKYYSAISKKMDRKGKNERVKSCTTTVIKRCEMPWGFKTSRQLHSFYAKRKTSRVSESTSIPVDIKLASFKVGGEELN